MFVMEIPIPGFKNILISSISSESLDQDNILYAEFDVGITIP